MANEGEILILGNMHIAIRITPMTEKMKNIYKKEGKNNETVRRI